VGRRSRGQTCRPPPFDLIVETMYYICNVVPPTLAVALSKVLTVRTWPNLAWSFRFGGPANPFFFQKTDMGCHCSFSPYHVAAPDWATW
jgi:hypothetical protein